MTSTSRTPHVLEPYLAPRQPRGSLTLVTGTLGASTSWLVLQHLCRHVQGGRPWATGGSNVVLVSFLRDFAFWREGCARLVCLTPSTFVTPCVRDGRDVII